MKSIYIVSCSLFAMALFAAMAVGSDLSPGEMASTVGGGNCKRCPTSPNESGPTMSCTIYDTFCHEREGCDYKSCEDYNHPDAQCENDTWVTEYYYKYCDDGEGDCDVAGEETDCSCHSLTVQIKGCV